MNLIDLLLNIAGLLLWLNWRANRFDPLVKRLPTTLMGTLRPAAPKRLQRWHMVAFLVVLLFLRAPIYQWIGWQTHWSAKLNLGVVVLWFQDTPHWIGYCRMLLFSFCSFGVILGIFYTWLLALSLLAGPTPIHGLVKIPLGRLDDIPRWAKAVLPFLVTAILWGLTSWLLVRVGVLPPMPAGGRFQQSLVLGASTYLLWQYPLGAILVLHLLNSYIYFGKHPFWNYVDATAQTLLRPLKRIPLRAGKIDFAPLVGLAVLFLAARFVEKGVQLLHIPGLTDIFKQLPL
ncbi:MAG TPA: hypothetical protein VF988_08915 [Verrucomicrobiae bacterium]